MLAPAAFQNEYFVAYPPQMSGSIFFTPLQFTSLCQLQVISQPCIVAELHGWPGRIIVITETRLKGDQHPEKCWEQVRIQILTKQKTKYLNHGHVLLENFPAEQKPCVILCRKFDVVVNDSPTVSKFHYK